MPDNSPDHDEFLGVYGCFRIRRDGGVAWITIDHPPLNLLDKAMMVDFHHLTKRLADERSVRVAVFDSANPDFFIAHAELNLLIDGAAEAPRDSGRLNIVQAIGERLRTMSIVSIAKIAGRARGGGSELALAMDMRFGAYGRTILSQPEVMLGILPGGGATQRLARLVGRARALEIVLGCADFDALTAERYGWLNRALPPDTLDAFVEQLARRIAGFPQEALAATKQSTTNALPGFEEGLIEENRLFDVVVRQPEAGRRMKRFLEVGGQTREAELDLDPMAEALLE